VAVAAFRQESWLIFHLQVDSTGLGLEETCSGSGAAVLRLRISLEVGMIAKMACMLRKAVEWELELNLGLLCEEWMGEDVRAARRQVQPGRKSFSADHAVDPRRLRLSLERRLLRRVVVV
jgi:hypothetical protein